MSDSAKFLDDEVVKNYTRARRFPQLVGVTHDGTRLPGGPYTYTQFIGGGVVVVVMWQTSGLWATGGLLRNAAVLIAVVGLTVWGLGRMPLKGRNPLSVVVGVTRALLAGVGSSAPVDGQVPGRRAGPGDLGGAVVVLSAPRSVGAVGDARESLESDENEVIVGAATVDPLAVSDARAPDRAVRRAVGPRPAVEPRTSAVTRRTGGHTAGRVPTGNADRLLAMAAARREAS